MGKSKSKEIAWMAEVEQNGEMIAAAFCDM